MKYLILYIIITIPFFIKSQNNYSLDSIPAALLENVNAVVRIDKTEFKIKNNGKAILNQYYVITILNEKGAEFKTQYATYYDKFDKIKKIKGKVYNKNGKKIYKLSKNDIFDYSASASSADIIDSRQKVADFGIKSFNYPYTIELITSVETTNMMFYPSINFGSEKQMNTQNKSLVIETPSDFKYRYFEKNIPNHATILNLSKKKIYTWTLNNIMHKDDDDEYESNYYNKAVYTAPIDFKIENYEGSIESWSDIGIFISKLYAGRDKLPEDIKQKVKELVQNEKDTLKKTEILYTFLQNTTRYINIQLGFGGWQTMSAMEVAQKGYGDCKALSNYMMSLLKEAGIPSYLVFVNAGINEEDIIENFPNLGFNHVITCVPISNDTIWLECTSQTNAFNYLGSFTGNKKALLILPKGGKLVNTLKYNANDNKTITKTDIQIKENGNADAFIKTIYTGISKETKNFHLNTNNNDQLKLKIQNSIELPNFEIKKYSFKETKSKIPELEINLDLNIKNISNKTGSIFFIKPYIFNINELEIPDKKTRLTDFYLNPNKYEFEKIDSINIHLPNLFIIEKLQEPIHIKTLFGEYSNRVTITNGYIKFYRKLIFHSGIYLAKDYPDLINFMKEINKFDNLQISYKINSN